eukprot:1110144-Amphidinium_carterae.1
MNDDKLNNMLQFGMHDPPSILLLEENRKPCRSAYCHTGLWPKTNPNAYGDHALRTLIDQ